MAINKFGCVGVQVCRYEKQVTEVHCTGRELPLPVAVDVFTLTYCLSKFIEDTALLEYDCET
jgi:hypothetical protein